MTQNIYTIQAQDMPIDNQSGWPPTWMLTALELFMYFDYVMSCMPYLEEGLEVGCRIRVGL